MIIPLSINVTKRNNMPTPINGLQFSTLFLKTFGFKSLILGHLEIFLKTFGF